MNDHATNMLQLTCTAELGMLYYNSLSNTSRQFLNVTLEV